MNDMTIAPGPGIPDGAVIAADLAERFAKSLTPGGQGVNTTDGKVQLSIDVAECASLTDAQRHRISRNLEHRLDGSVFYRDCVDSAVCVSLVVLSLAPATQPRAPRAVAFGGAQ
nr:hypothetical protein [Corynebacterium sp. Marseille-P3884]